MAAVDIPALYLISVGMLSAFHSKNDTGSGLAKDGKKNYTLLLGTNNLNNCRQLIRNYKA